MTPEQALEGMALAKEAGIRPLLSFIFDLGARERSHEHIAATTRLLNQLQPKEIAPMALAIQPGTELEQDVLAGRFVPPTPMQLLEEENYLLANLADLKTYYWGDHGNNLSLMRGWLPDNRAVFLQRVGHAIAKHPIAQQECGIPWRSRHHHYHHGAGDQGAPGGRPAFVASSVAEVSGLCRQLHLNRDLLG